MASEKRPGTLPNGVFKRGNERTTVREAGQEVRRGSDHRFLMGTLGALLIDGNVRPRADDVREMLAVRAQELNRQSRNHHQPEGGAHEFALLRISRDQRNRSNDEDQGNTARGGSAVNP